jgi:hypothetical protein
MYKYHDFIRPDPQPALCYVLVHCLLTGTHVSKIVLPY